MTRNKILERLDFLFEELILLDEIAGNFGFNENQKINARRDEIRLEINNLRKVLQQE